MPGEDRVVTTQLLWRMHDETTGDLLVPASLLEGLDPDGFHVLVPRGHVHGPGDPRLVCSVQLATSGAADATVVDVMVDAETFEELPGAFEVLRTASALVPACVASVEDELATLGDGGPTRNTP